MSTFELHPRLAADSHVLADWPLCRLLLGNDARYPWFILVPRRPKLREIHDLGEADQRQLLRESSALGRAALHAFAGDKLNLAALGNVVPQLHVHHIVRRVDDPAWPAPVWGKLAPLPYDAASRRGRIAALAGALPAEFSLTSDAS